MPKRSGSSSNNNKYNNTSSNNNNNNSNNNISRSNSSSDVNKSATKHSPIYLPLPPGNPSLSPCFTAFVACHKT